MAKLTREDIVPGVVVRGPNPWLRWQVVGLDGETVYYVMLSDHPHPRKTTITALVREGRAVLRAGPGRKTG